MKHNILTVAIIVAALSMIIAACDTLPPEPVRDSTSDPLSADWVAQRPFIYSVTKTPDNHVTVKWIANTNYGSYFRIDRRVEPSGSYTFLGNVPGPLTTGAYVDSSSIPLGFTYGYRVGVVGSAGATTYSYDFPIDMF